MKKTFTDKIIGILCTLAVLCSAHTVIAVSVDQNPGYIGETELLSIAEGIIQWKIESEGEANAGKSLDELLSEGKDSSANDWFVIGLSRLMPDEKFPNYLKKLEKRAAEGYRAAAFQNSVVTDFHRMTLSILAAGGDPTHLEVQGEKAPINLVAEFTYNWGEKASLGKQGINGWIWALILLDTMRYEIPESAFYQREDMIRAILSLQKTSGGFALAGETADPDITAMTIQALSPYYESETQYTYFRVADQRTVTGTVRQTVDEALAFLSVLQLDTGDFRSFGNPNSQTGMQVVIALTSIGLDPQTLNEFIKDDTTLVDGMLRYRMPDGGFAHMLPASVSNGKASEQALCATAALIRQKRGEGTFYDYRLASGDTQQGAEDSSANGGYIVMVVAAVILLPILLIASIALIRKKKWIPLVLLLVGALAVGWFFYRLDIQSPDNFFLENPEVISPGSRTAFIRIDCSTVIRDPKRLPAHLSDFRILPEDGVILPETEYLLPEGDTAFDLLMKAVRYQKIQMDFRGNPENRTGAVYVRSIGHLYEFACGPLSGWLFKVNGEFSDNDSSKTVLEDKDRVEWIYTCDLGRDIGNEFEDESQEIFDQTGGS